MNKIILLLLAVLVFCSCMRADDFAVNGVEGFDFSGLSRSSVTLSVTNRSGKNITLRSGRLTLERGGRSVAEVMLADEVTVARRSEGSVEVPLRMKVNDPLQVLAFSMGESLLDAGLTVSGEMSVKAGGMRRTFSYERMPLPEFLSIFGIGRKEIESLKI